jgi:hypothetical protein
MMLGEALGAVAALQQESIAGGDLTECAFQPPRFAREDERGKSRKLFFDFRELRPVRIFRNLQNGFRAPAIRRPTLGHEPILHAT